MLKDSNASADIKQSWTKERESVKETFFNCSQNMELFNQGVLCYLLSGQATERTIIVDGEVIVYVDTVSVVKDIKLCFDVFKGICNGVQFVQDSTSKAQCESYIKALQCVQTEDSCVKQIVNNIVE